MIYDLLFFFMVIIIVLNLIFGVIIDTFADLRSEKQKKEEILKTTCFICGKYLPSQASRPPASVVAHVDTRRWGGHRTDSKLGCSCCSLPSAALPWQTAEVSEASPAGGYLGT